MTSRQRTWHVVLVALMLVLVIVSTVGCDGSGQKPKETTPPPSVAPNQGEKAPTTSKGGIPSKLTIGVSEAGSQWYVIGGAIGEALKKAFPGTTVHLFQGGGYANLQAIDNKQIDIGITLSVAAATPLQARGVSPNR